MNKYKKPEITEEKLGKNPFLLSLKIETTMVASKNKFKHDKSEDIWLPAEDEWEKVPFTRVYSDKQRRLMMVELNDSGKGLLLWLIYEAETGEDWMWLNKVRYMEETGRKSVNTYKSALNELIKKGFIAKTVIQDVFWINPHFFFNGNRIKSFPDNVIKK